MIGSVVFERLPNDPFEFGRVVRDEVGQVAELGVAPSRFDRVEFGSVGRQPLKVDVFQPRSRDLFGRRAMHTPTIQNDDQGTAKAVAQGLDKRHGFGRANVVGVNLKRRADSSTLGRKRHGADDAQPVIPFPGSLHGSLAAGRPRLAIHRLQAKAGFINKCNSCATSTRFFLIRGQSFLSHRSTASASCSRATRRSFWGVYPRSCKMRPTWSGWYETRNSLRTALATRAQVHKSVLKPEATGPAFRMASSSCFCSHDNLGVGPGCGLAANAATPPFRQARFQRFTLERLAPTSRAVSARDFPAWKCSAARRRRASSSVALPLVLINTHTLLAHHLVQLQRSFQ